MPATSPAVAVARHYLDTHATEVVRLDTLARLTSLSTFHLIRVFRAATGVTPYAYLMERRIAYASAYLRAGTPPSRVAHLAGFSDQSHFTRHFKRLLGVTPGQYARALATAQ